MKEIISKSNNKSQLHNRYEYEIVSIPIRYADPAGRAHRESKTIDRRYRVRHKESGKVSAPLTLEEARRILKSTSVRGGAS